MDMLLIKDSSRTEEKLGFSLIEVVLAIGIFLITVLALVGLLGPTLESVGEVEKIDEVASVVNTVNAFLQNSPEIETGGASKFDTIFSAVASGNEATIFVYKQYTSSTGTNERIRVGFLGETGAALTAADFSDLAGTVYRVVLTASSAIPETHRSAARNGDGILTLSSGLAAYDEGFFAMEVRIFAIDDDTRVSAGGAGTLPGATNLANLSSTEPLFTYNTAIVR